MVYRKHVHYIFLHRIIIRLDFSLLSSAHFELLSERAAAGDAAQIHTYNLTCYIQMHNYTTMHL